MFDQEHQNNNYVHMSPFCTSESGLDHTISEAAPGDMVSPAMIAANHYSGTTSMSTWSDLELKVEVELFDKADADDSGRLSLKEIQALLESIDIHVRESKLKMLFDQADGDNSGDLDRKEALSIVKSALDYERLREKEALHRAEQVVLGENQLIDRYGRASSRGLIEIFREQAQVMYIIRQRERVTAKSMAIAASGAYILLNYAIDYVDTMDAGSY